MNAKMGTNTNAKMTAQEYLFQWRDQSSMRLSILYHLNCDGKFYGGELEYLFRRMTKESIVKATVASTITLRERFFTQHACPVLARILYDDESRALLDPQSLQLLEEAWDILHAARLRMGAEYDMFSEPPRYESDALLKWADYYGIQLPQPQGDADE